jgi:hypothetical protein
VAGPGRAVPAPPRSCERPFALQLTGRSCLSLMRRL